MQFIKNIVKLYIMLFLIPAGMNAQNYYNIRLLPLETLVTKQACYEIQLASAQAADFNLAGQNYRLYYDASSLQYNEEASKSLLSPAQYTAAITKDNLFNIDASGIGVLPFESHLAFLNIGIDLSDVENGGLNLPASQEWQSSMQICFDVLQQSETNELTYKKEIYWARVALTDAYATAFVEIAEWVAPNETQAAIAENYFDVDLSTSLTTLPDANALIWYPNPTKDKVWLNYQSKNPIQIKVWNIQGKLILEQEVNAQNGLLHFNLDNQPSGQYQVKLIDGKKVFTESIEKIH